jgi:hypothetical protein
MNLATPVRPSSRSRTGPARVDRPRMPASGNESGTLVPVAPVVFLEPGQARRTPAPHHRRADQGEDNLRPLRTPFATDMATDR